MNTLCESEVLSYKVSDHAENAHIEEGIKIKPVNVGKFLVEIKLYFQIFRNLELEEDGVRIALTIVDTPGFGENIDNEDAYVSDL